jgi:hypothetical protein
MVETGLTGETLKVIGTAEWSVGEGTPGWVLDWSRAPLDAVPSAFRRDASLGYKRTIKEEDLVALAHELARSMLKPGGAVFQLQQRAREARTLYDHFKGLHEESPTTADVIELWESIWSWETLELPDPSLFDDADARVADVAAMAEEVKTSFDSHDDDVRTAAGAQRALEKIRWRIEEAQWALERHPPGRPKGALSEMNAYLHAMTDEGRGGDGVIKALDYTKTGCWAVFTVAGGAVFGATTGVVFTLGAVGGLLDAAANELGRDDDVRNWDRDVVFRIVWNSVISGVTNVGGGKIVDKLAKWLVAPLSKLIVSKLGAELLGKASVEAAEEHVKDVLKEGFGNAIGGAITDVASAWRAGEWWPNWTDFLMHIVANLMGGVLAGKLNANAAALIEQRMNAIFAAFRSKTSIRMVQ